MMVSQVDGRKDEATDDGEKDIEKELLVPIGEV